MLNNLLKMITYEWKGGRIAHKTSEWVVSGTGTFSNPEDQKRTKSGRKADGSEDSTRIPIRGKVQEDHARETAAMH